MLYRYTEVEENGENLFDLDRVESFGAGEGGLPYDIIERTLENILAEVFSFNGVYMPIFQERPIQPEPDLVALDENGNLILFELKRGYIDKKAALDDRLFRYHSVWKNFSYDDLNKNYRKYKKDNSADLLDDHKKFFGVSLSKSDFNRAQKLIAVANVVSDDLIDYIKSLNKRGDYTVDFIPYRFYKIGKEVFIEFSSKPFDDDFVGRRRHNLICKIASALNDKMDYSFCSSHKFSRKYFDGSNLDFRKWNGHERFIISFSREFLFSGATDLHVQGFSLGVGEKNFYISFRVWNNQDSVVSCSEAAKNIPALNNVKFKRMSDSKGEEYFRYDLPISSKYPTVDFVEMDDAARSLFDGKNFDAAINHIILEMEQFFTLLTSTAPQITSSFTPPTTKTNTPPAKTNGEPIPDTNLTWRLDDNGTLTISGKGDMSHCHWQTKNPWFDKKDLIQTVVVEPGVTSIGDMAFNLCGNLTEITIPYGVTKIGFRAFNFCESLTRVILPDSVTEIGSYAFNCCKKLETITFSARILEISDNAFGGCSSLRSVNLPGGLKSIDGAAFFKCASLTEIKIPPSVTWIARIIFNECKSLQTIRYKRGLEGAEKLGEGNSARLIPY